MELNKEQKEAIEKTDGKISVVAGPGSGKTRVLIERVLNLIKMGKPQSKILLITFTNKVREEIIERLFNEIGENDVKIHTFHSFASEIIKKYFKEINVNKNLKILDEDDLKLLILESQYALISENEIFKNEAIDIDEFIKSGLYKNKLSLKSVFTKKLVDKFNLLKSENNYSTYDDLIESLFLILKKVKLRNQIVKTIDYLMIDECQDLNEEQYVIVELLEKSGLKNIFMVGDLDQSIYAWRGARPNLFLNFYNNSYQIKLKNNYRSHKDIIEIAKKLISFNDDRIHIDYAAKAEHKEGSVQVLDHVNNDMQSKYISEEILNIFKKGEKPNDIAILFRMNYQAKTIINELIINKIYYKIYNEKEFYAKKEIKDVISLLKILNDDSDLISWRRTIDNLIKLSLDDNLYIYRLKEKNFKDKIELLFLNKEEDEAQIFKRFLNIINDLQKNQSLNYLEKTLLLLKELKYKKLVFHNNNEIIDNVDLFLAEVKSSIMRKISLDEFLLNLGLGNNDKDDEKCIKLMSIHSAKGLEFNQVFILNVNQGIIPHKHSIETSDISEERRLMYVGITRAKKHLYLNYTTDKEKSIFLDEI